MDMALILSGLAVLIAFVGMLLNSRKDTRNDAANSARMEAKLDNANAGISDIRVEVRSMQATLQNHSERLAKVEARAASNTHRLDRLDHGSRADDDD